MKDSVIKAVQARASQMNFSPVLHEAEVSFGGECDLCHHYENCPKNPHHTQFKTLEELHVNCLPDGYQDTDLFKCILGLFHLTVRVANYHVSDGRPDCYSGCDIPFPFADIKGKGMMLTGTGWVRSVTPLPKLDNFGTNHCEKSEHSGSSNTEGAEIVIRTAAHVVFNEEEGKQTTCHFFFDEGGMPDGCKGAIALEEATQVVSNIDGDWSDMTFITHDKILAEKLFKMVSEYVPLHQKVWDKFPADDNNDETRTKTKLNLAVIVSHPHGRRKRVSFGIFHERDEMGSCNNWTRYTYTTPTCSGSSGAPVFILGWSRRWAWCSHPHSGKCIGVEQLNYSGIGSN